MDLKMGRSNNYVCVSERYSSPLRRSARGTVFFGKCHDFLWTSYSGQEVKLKTHHTMLLFKCFKIFLNAGH